MVATAAFVIIFLAIGVAVVLIAMSGGPAGVRENLLHRQSRGASRTSSASIAAVIAVFGLALPAVVMVANAEDGAKDAPGGATLTAGEENGRKVFAELCSTCHALAASNAVGRVGPDLDQLRPPKELTLNAIEQGRAQGRGQMPAGLVDGEDAEDVAEYIAKVAGRN
ncbi:c-type cytochrome [Paraconexibacter sp.]|uniref:cytochrome c n=1 Tax=Paraconexibacter sp. TaxID=2949640 RepID=UPI0035671CB3